MPHSQRQPASEDDLRRAKPLARGLLQALDGFAGVGIGAGTLRVYLRDAEAAAEVPDEIDGVPVETVIVGEVTTR